MALRRPGTPQECDLLMDSLKAAHVDVLCDPEASQHQKALSIKMMQGMTRDILHLKARMLGCLGGSED